MVRLPLHTLALLVIFIALLWGHTPATYSGEKTASSLPDAIKQLKASIKGPIKEIPSQDPNLKVYRITLSQPLDHAAPDDQHFDQEVFLTHRDPKQPMVLIPFGYGVSRNFIMDMTRRLKANQLMVPNRFFKGAEPADKENKWSFLTIKQSAADLHNIVKIFKNIYKGKWVSSSRSKGGTDALVHRRLYPGDVDATVAYVAPIPTQVEDPRVTNFVFHPQRPAKCVSKLKKYQHWLLDNKKQLLPLLLKNAQRQKWSFKKVSPEAAFEYAVLEYPFSFWQYYKGHCDDVPQAGNPHQCTQHALKMLGIHWYSDAMLKKYNPSYYQCYTEAGTYGYVTAHLEDKLKAVKNPSNRIYLPDGVTPKFDTTSMKDILNWLEKKGDYIIYIYGQNDPWTAAAVNPAPHLDSLKIVLPGASHTVRFSHLPAIDQERVTRKLESWLGTTTNQ